VPLLRAGVVQAPAVHILHQQGGLCQYCGLGWAALGWAAVILHQQCGLEWAGGCDHDVSYRPRPYTFYINKVGGDGCNCMSIMWAGMGWAGLGSRCSISTRWVGMGWGLLFYSILWAMMGYLNKLGGDGLLGNVPCTFHFMSIAWVWVTTDVRVARVPLMASLFPM
jgi:hypothetical protein